MPEARDAARIRIAREGLSQAAAERVARTSFRRMPITLVDRARAQLRRFFSEEPWTADDDAALSALVGPGEGWTEEELAPGLRTGFGWRGGVFAIDLSAAAPVTAPAAGPEHERSLGDTFEDTLVVEGGRNPAELRFVAGPGVGGTGRFTRDEQGRSAGVAALFREFDDITEVRIDRGAVTVVLDDPQRWHELALAIFDTVERAFVAPRGTPPDRQFERAVSELGPLDCANPRDLARLVDATTSPDTAYRRVAVAKLETADQLVVTKPWTRALDDPSRSVRRAALRAMAHVARPDLRLLFERALVDKDPCVRYYALRGLAQIGVERAQQSVDKRRRDDDARVRLAAQAAYEGRLPV